MERFPWVSALFLTTALAAGAARGESAPDWPQLRADFLAAEQALQRGAMTRYRKLSEYLGDYPLYPYLHYEYLRRRLHHAPPQEIAEFIERYGDSPLGVRLRHAWIEALVRRGRWPLVIEHYRPSGSTELECRYRWALYNNGDRPQAFTDIERLWLVGHSQPRACDPLFAAWQREHEPGPELIWGRFRLAMGNGDTRLARYLSHSLEPDEQAWAELWLKVHGSPALVLSDARLKGEHPMRNAILIHGIKRMARRDLEAALRAWEPLQQRYVFSTEESAAVERHLALTAAVRGHPAALERLAVVEQGLTDTRLREWRVRAALNQNNWYAALAWLYQLDDEERDAPRWRYWQARALEELHQHAQAEEIYLALAVERGYYGFLAADRMELPYQFNHQPVTEDGAQEISYEEHPGLLRARELYLLERPVEARREWYMATRGLSDGELHAAAKLAQSWGWVDRAITTAALSTQRDDLELRFPVAHREQVVAEAKLNGVDPALAFAIIRQESAFTPDARSRAGALGLMQLLPRTARHVTQGMNMPYPGHTALLDVRTNLQIGMAYLRSTLDLYRNHSVLATAAYNAGERRVNRWLPQEGVIAADLWAETLPFNETRDYVQNVLLFTTIYEQRLGRAPTPLTERMPPIVPRGTVLTQGGERRAAADPGPT